MYNFAVGFAVGMDVCLVLWNVERGDVRDAVLLALLAILLIVVAVMVNAPDKTHTRGGRE